jgi:uncharacterized membrane protein
VLEAPAAGSLAEALAVVPDPERVSGHGKAFRAACHWVGGRPYSPAEVMTMASTSLRDVLDQLAEWERHHRPSIPPPPMAPLSSLEERLADRITAFAGSMRFVYLHSAWFGLWILVNLGLVSAVTGGLLPPFDPFPFGLLTMVVSLEAIFLTTFVMISQNRQAALADQRAELDYQVNVKAEAETAKLLMLVEALIAHHAELATSEVREPSRPPTPPNT